MPDEETPPETELVKPAEAAPTTSDEPQIVEASDDIEVAPRELVVIARNAGEMQEAQSKLVAWSGRKVADVKEELFDYEKNLELAKKNKWNTKALVKAVEKTKDRVEFYTKVRAALEAGYCIVPNFPMDVFAVRTTRVNPNRNETFGHHTSIRDQVTNSPPAGDGRYVNSQVDAVSRRSYREKDANGRDQYDTSWLAKKFKEVDFPFSLAKTRIVESTDKAMTAKIFDEIGILPFRSGRDTQPAPMRQALANADPMIIGRVKMRKNPYAFQEVSFLVAWFVDSRDL